MDASEDAMVDCFEVATFDIDIHVAFESVPPLIRTSPHLHRTASL
jgi:hypothetical protein